MGFTLFGLSIVLFCLNTARGQILIVGPDGTSSCQDNVAINNGIGQSFKFPSPTGFYSYIRIQVFIKPELYYTTSYTLTLRDGAGPSGTVLATSAQLSLNSQTSGVPATFYEFAINGLSLTQGATYTWILTRTSTYSGGFRMCSGNIYADGVGYWLASSQDGSNDYAFKLYADQLPAATYDPIQITFASPCKEVSIGSAIGQSFFHAGNDGYFTVNIAVYIKPSTTVDTTYNLQLFKGDSASGTSTATSSNVVVTRNGPCDYYTFTVTASLKFGNVYSWKLVTVGTNSGTASQCGNLYNRGNALTGGTTPDTTQDFLFKFSATGAWKCFTDITTPIRYVNGNVECMATDGANCLWGTCPDSITSTNPATIKPLVCGAAHLALYGSTGYSDPTHWCARGLVYFQNL